MGAGGDIRGKVSMKKLFGRRNIKKDGTEGKVRPGQDGGLGDIRSWGGGGAWPSCVRGGWVVMVECVFCGTAVQSTNPAFPPPRPALPQLLVLPAVEELQRGEDTRWRWVNYSAFDAKVRGLGLPQEAAGSCSVSPLAAEGWEGRSQLSSLANNLDPAS